MKPDKNKDITEHMAEVLRKHALPYKEGSWEQFKEFEAAKRKRIVLWPYFTAAAAMLLVTITLFFNNREGDDIDSNLIVKSTITTDQVSGLKVEPSEENTANENLITQSTVTPVGKSDKRNLIANNDITSKIQSESKSSLNHDSHQVDHSAAASPIVASNQISSIESGVFDSKREKTNDLPQPSETQVLAAVKSTESKVPVSAENENRKVFKPNSDVFSKQDFAYDESSESANKLARNSEDKWNFSLEVSPNIMDNDVNFGGGIGVTYNLSKKLSISSGVSYVQLSANRNVNQPAEIAKTSSSTYNYSKSLNGVNTSLSGLDIPVNLKLNINSNMYASAGISVFNVINESRLNSFEERVAEIAYSSPVESSPNQKAPEPLVHTVYSQELSADTPYQGKNFTGFFNFSVGYKLPFLQKLQLAIEPYVKIPVGSLSEQDMDLSNGGLKIITNF